MGDDKVEVQELESATQKMLLSLFKDNSKFAYYGHEDTACVMAIDYKDDVDFFKNMAVRPDDVWVNTFPRSGTTWTQELVWLLKNDLDYETASKISLLNRYLFIKFNQSGVPERLKKIPIALPSNEDIANAPSPRFFKTHMPLSLLPSNILDSKVVYVARDPRDVAVSLYHIHRWFSNYVGDFKTYWNLFINDLVTHGPYFSHIKQAWALRDHPNMLFVFYEDMARDMPSCIKRLAKFLGKEVTNEQIVRLCEHLDIKNFRENESVNPSWRSEIGNPIGESFIRKGKVGGWRDYFDAAMAAQAQVWLRENLADTDLRFPDTS